MVTTADFQEYWASMPEGKPTKASKVDFGQSLLETHPTVTAGLLTPLGVAFALDVISNEELERIVMPSMSN